MSEYESSDLLDMTAEIVSSYVSNNQVEADALPQLITNIYETRITFVVDGKPWRTYKGAVEVICE